MTFFGVPKCTFTWWKTITVSYYDDFVNSRGCAILFQEFLYLSFWKWSILCILSVCSTWHKLLYSSTITSSPTLFVKSQMGSNNNERFVRCPQLAASRLRLLTHSRPRPSVRKEERREWTKSEWGKGAQARTWVKVSPSFLTRLRDFGP